MPFTPGWTFTHDVDEYAAHVGALLDDPERHTIALTVIEQERRNGPSPSGATLFGWWTDASGDVRGQVSVTPPYAPLVEIAPEESFPALLDALIERLGEVRGISAPAEVALPFVSAASHRTRWQPVLHHGTRLFRCLHVRPPSPMPRGTSRAGRDDDVPLLVEWMHAFMSETHSPVSEGLDELVRRRIGWDGFRLWCTEAGDTVSLAGTSLPAAGTSRIGPVYTPPELRRRGYGGAVTWAATRDVQGQGLAAVLFTDLANPTSNALYPRLGYQPVADRAVFRLEPT